MSKLLPLVVAGDDYYRERFNPVEFWSPALHAILGHHQLKAQTITRFSSGEYPVFDLDHRSVVKLVPGLWVDVLDREIEALGFLAGRTPLPVPALIAHGRLEGWGYMISTRLPGQSLSEIWKTLDPSARAPVAGEFGRVHAELHRVSVGDFAPGGLQWNDFIAERIALWPNLRHAKALPAVLHEAGPGFLARARLDHDDSPLVLLHGDLAPENILMAKTGDTWVCSGLFDFGQARRGRALFDFAASTLLLAPGDRAVIHRFFAGYGLGAGAIGRMRARLMAYALLHPLGHLPNMLKLIPGLDLARSWEEVAEKFWPE